MKAANDSPFLKSVVPLNINGLSGRMLTLGQTNRRKPKEILLIYGQHSSLETWFGYADLLSRYGNVTMPDLPGFGGMSSMSKVHLRPTLNNLADYLAAFVKLRYKRKRLTIVAIGFGFVVTTRMLQRYPDLVKKIDLVINVGGIVHHEDLKLTKIERLWYLAMARVGSLRLTSFLTRTVYLRHLMVRQHYERWDPSLGLAKWSATDFIAEPTEEASLWRLNDLRTHLRSCVELLKLDNCQQSVNVPLGNIELSGRRLINRRLAEQHVRVTYPQTLVVTRTRLSNRDTLELNDMKVVAKLLPADIRQLLSASR